MNLRPQERQADQNGRADLARARTLCGAKTLCDEYEDGEEHQARRVRAVLQACEN